MSSRAALRLLALTSLSLTAAPAAAERRDLCPTRPGLGTPPCIVDRGHLMLEVGLVDWTLDRTSDSRTDTLLFGDGLARFGLTTNDELELGWTAYGHVRTRDKATGDVTRDSGTGDILVAIKHSVRNPGGDGVSIALQPSVTLPVGGSAIGAGDWSAGLLLPISIDLGESLQLQATPEIDASADNDRHGRHLVVGTVVGVGYDLTEKLSATFELSAFRDRDPAGHVTNLLAGLSAAYQPSDRLQLDAGVALGLNRDTPDAEFSIGISTRL